MATTYTVKQGDTLSKIASQNGVTLSEITGYKSGDPNKIGIGEVLNIGGRVQTPANTAPATGLGGTAVKPAPVAPLTGYAALQESSNAVITNLQTDVDADKATIKSKYDRLGDLAIGDACPVCGEAAQSWWLQVASNGETHHMCGSCATSE